MKNRIKTRIISSIRQDRNRAFNLWHRPMNRPFLVALKRISGGEPTTIKTAIRMYFKGEIRKETMVTAITGGVLFQPGVEATSTLRATRDLPERWPA